MLNQRRVALLRFLLAPGDRVNTVATLAARLGVSERLIRYDLAEIGDWVRRKGAQVRHDPRSGICIDGDCERVLADLESVMRSDKPPAEYILTPAERHNWIMTLLLEQGDPVPIGTLADQLGVSRGTIYSDLHAVAERLGQYGLQLTKRPKRGVCVSGPETGIREALVALALERIGMDQLVLLIAQCEQTDRWELEPYDLPPGPCFRAALRALRAVEDYSGLGLTDVWFAEAVLHLAFAVHRVRQGKHAEFPGLPATDAPEWRTARLLVEQVEALSGTSMPASEVAPLAELIQKAGRRVCAAGRELPHSPDAVYLARRFAAVAESLLAVDLAGDSDFISGLALHLQPIPHRLAQSPPIVNPLLEQIREMYPELFAAARQAAAVLKEAWGLPVPEAEVGYLTMHLGAALERRRLARPRRHRVVAVCSSGVGTARLLASRLQAALPEVELVAVTSLLSLGETLRTCECDLVVATCPVPEIATPVVQVSPLLFAGDLRAIRDALAPEGYVHSFQRRGYPPMLSDVLTEQLIRLGVEAADWEAAVRAAGRVLVDNGAVEPRYVDAMVEGLRRVGPYIVVAPGVALPHARPEDGVRRLAISMVQLRDPVAFGHETNDPVSLVFALAAVDVDSHLKALSQLSSIISNPEHVARLRSAQDVAEVLKVVFPNTAGKEEGACGS